MAKSFLPTLFGRSGGDTLDTLHDEINRVFRDFSRGWPGAPGFAGGVGLSVDVAETDKALEITTEIPGRRRQGHRCFDLQWSIDDQGRKALAA
jgi:HSP20 family molecular chaperone IbpA